MGLVRLLALIGVGLLLLAGGLAWIFAEPYIIAAILILVVWKLYTKPEKN